MGTNILVRLRRIVHKYFENSVSSKQRARKLLRRDIETLFRSEFIKFLRDVSPRWRRVTSIVELPKDMQQSFRSIVDKTTTLIIEEAPTVAVLSTGIRKPVVERVSNKVLDMFMKWACNEGKGQK